MATFVYMLAGAMGLARGPSDQLQETVENFLGRFQDGPGVVWCSGFTVGLGRSGMKGTVWVWPLHLQ